MAQSTAASGVSPARTCLAPFLFMDQNMMNALTGIGAAILLLVGSGAHAQTYDVILAGAAENPPNVSAGIATGRLVLDSQLNTLKVDVTFAGLAGVTTGAAIHCCVTPPGNAGIAITVPGLPGFPPGVAAGTYSRTLDLTQLSTYAPNFLVSYGGGTTSGSAAAIALALSQGMVFLRIRTTVYTAGEIRGFPTLSPFVFGDGFEGGVGN